VVLTAAIGGLGGLLFGYDAGVIAAALLFLKRRLRRWWRFGCSTAPAGGRC